ncbi:MAG: FprA family A-type flavoprotein [Firmicutes bacterium]|nr:FprA family A-type flavoprotein [Bacillota bacterium]
MSFLPAVNEGLLYVGASDRRNPYFENVYPIGRGASFNSYLYLDEKTALLDTADASVTEVFFSNVSAGLGGRNLDYLIVQHMEPDHAANIARVMAEYPACTVVCNDKVRKMISNFFGAQEESRFHIVKEGDKLPLGKRTLTFLFAPMVHWPEVMMTFEEREGVLFSADAFGTFGALSGNLFADEVNFAEEWLAEARRYYTNIVGKYGVQVQAVLKKAANLPIRTICPLHGPVWRKDLGFILEKYNRWSTYQPEEKGALVVYGSVYGNTERAAKLLAEMLGERGVPVRLYDVSRTDVSYLVAEAFRFDRIVLASSTYNGGIFSPMEYFITELKKHNLSGRKFALIENGSWAPVAGKLMAAMVAELKQTEIVGETVTMLSAVKPETEAALAALARILAE